jgi:hypothetical protein
MDIIVLGVAAALALVTWLLYRLAVHLEPRK